MLQRALGLYSAGSTIAVHGLSCSAVALWDLPGPGIELVSPALQCVFLTTGPPEKPEFTSKITLKYKLLNNLKYF